MTAFRAWWWMEVKAFFVWGGFIVKASEWRETKLLWDGLKSSNSLSPFDHCSLKFIYLFLAFTWSVSVRQVSNILPSELFKLFLTSKASNFKLLTNMARENFLKMMIYCQENDRKSWERFSSSLKGKCQPVYERAEDWMKWREWRKERKVSRMLIVGRTEVFSSPSSILRDRHCGFLKWWFYMVKKTFISLLKLLNLINYFNLVFFWWGKKFFLENFLLLKTTAKEVRQFTVQEWNDWLTLQSSWKLLIVDLCRVVLDRFAIVRQWICAFPLLNQRKK